MEHFCTFLSSNLYCYSFCQHLSLWLYILHRFVLNFEMSYVRFPNCEGMHEALTPSAPSADRPLDWDYNDAAPAKEIGGGIVGGGSNKTHRLMQIAPSTHSITGDNAFQVESSIGLWGARSRLNSLCKLRGVFRLWRRERELSTAPRPIYLFGAAAELEFVHVTSWFSSASRIQTRPSQNFFPYCFAFYARAFCRSR